VSQVWNSEEILFQYHDPRGSNFLNISLTDDEVLCVLLRNDQNLLEGTQLPMGLLFTTLSYGVKLSTVLKWSEMEPNIQSSRELIFGFRKTNNFFPRKENKYHLAKKISSPILYFVC
jgi:hypothetical protein